MSGGDGAQQAKWLPKDRDYVLETSRISKRSAFRRVRDHPLQGRASKSRKGGKGASADGDSGRGDDDTGAGGNDGEEEEKKKVVALDDPLSLLAATPLSVADDPLSALMGSGIPNIPTASRSRPTSKKQDVDTKLKPVEYPFEDWGTKRKERILEKYTTNKRIAVSVNFLDDGKDAEQEGAIKAVDHLASRLEQLETDPESEKAQNYMTQKEYIAHIKEQHDNLKTAWDNGERVLSLKIAIQCAKMLGDTKVPQFYPSMYVLLSDILLTFGNLVFERIKRKGVQIKDPSNAAASATALPDNFKAFDVSPDAKETCKNWFFKTACIRELLPRLYIEMTLLKCVRFLEDGTFISIFTRLSHQIRGIGDPLAAAYARSFLTTQTLDIAPVVPELYSDPKHLLSMFDDYLFTYRALKQDKFKSVHCVSEERITLDEYDDLFSPALEWLLQHIGHQSSEGTFFAIVQQYKDFCNNGPVLYLLLEAFDARYVSAHAMSMTTLIRQADESAIVPKSRLYLQLGRALITSSPPQDQRLPILNDVWKVVTKISDPIEYCNIAVVFVEYLLKHFSHREVNIFLKDVIKHVKHESAYKTLQEQLYGIVQKVLVYTPEFDKTLTMDNFLPLIDLLDKEHKVQAAKTVLTSLSRSQVRLSDPVILHTLFDVARSLHDSVDYLTFEDERRQISKMIIDFVRKIDFGRDLEKQLSTYVDCRQAFANLDQVTQELVLRTNLLATRAHQFMRGKHNKKTAAFVKACLAFCHITIPSLEDTFARLYLLLNCGQVALVNQMIVQSEAFLKAAISLIPEVPVQRSVHKRLVNTEEDLVSFVRAFTSFLLVFPGHPQHGPFYLIKGLLNAIQQYGKWTTATPGKASVYLGVLQLFCTYHQRTFPYHVLRVESNDRLYGGDDSYQSDLTVFVDTLVEELLVQLNEIGEAGDMTSKKEQGTLALEFVNVLLASFEMNPHSATLVVKLFQLAKKNGVVSKAYVQSTLEHIQSKKGSWYSDVAQKIQAMDE